MTDLDRISDQEGVFLLSIARDVIKKELFHNSDTSQDNSSISPKMNEKRGTFVTLTINNNLRGCIGNISSNEPIIKGIRNNAVNAAFHDPRFRPLSKTEWKDVKIEISILTEPGKLNYSDRNDLLEKLRPGIDGVIIKKGMHQSTFLPQVWDQLPEKREFLTHLCLKAGLDKNAWENESIEVLTYQVQAFEEK